MVLLIEQLVKPVVTAYVTAPVPEPPLLPRAELPPFKIVDGVAVATNVAWVPFPAETNVTVFGCD